MANTSAPFGFRQYSGTGSVPTYELVAVTIAYDATNIFYGDPVEPDSNGLIIQGDGTTAAAGIAGVFVGAQYLSVAQKRTVWSNYWPGSDVSSANTVIGYIINDPNAKFLVQTGSTGATQSTINLNAGYTTGSGNTANGISAAFLDVTTANTTSTLPFRVVALVTEPPGSAGTASGAFNYVVVGFNNVTTKNQTGI
tara:strand:- start:41 stop:628 length:588 start_codon:yes stop_codon:yes gene_type:complete